jgi:signal transduction histidine kinase
VDKLIERYWGVWKSVVPGNIAFTGTLGNEVSYIRMASDDFRWCVASLISNAVEAMPKGGELELRYYISPSENPQRKGANDIVIDLKDSGVGMEPSILAKAMQPFFSTKPGHAGLGLSQLQWTLESTGGSVRLRGNPEGGVTASIRLPAAEG